MIRPSHFFTFFDFKKISLFILILVCTPTHSLAQSRESTELSNFNLYLNLGGGFERGLTSVNLEKRLGTGKKLTWYARVGLAGGGIDDNNEGPGGLAGITMLLGKGKHHLEANGGLFVGININTLDEFIFAPIADLGYRFQKPEGGWIFQAQAGYMGFRLGVGYAFKHN